MRVTQALYSTVLAGLITVQGGCGAEAVRRTAPAAEERFAKQYFRVLVDSGVDAALLHMEAKTRAIPELPASLQELRNVLQRVPSDSLVLRRWKVSIETGRATTTKITYIVHGIEGRFLVGVWIENQAGRLVANTVFFGPEPEKGHLRGDS